MPRDYPPVDGRLEFMGAVGPCVWYIQVAATVSMRLKAGYGKTAILSRPRACGVLVWCRWMEERAGE